MTEYWILAVVFLFLFLLWVLYRSVRKKIGESRSRSYRRKKKEAERISRDGQKDVVIDVQEPPGDPEECWTPRGREISIRGHTISGGLIYVGEHLWNLHNRGVEPALIDPALPIAPHSKRNKMGSFKRGLSYRRISPAARAAYLKWLAGGRRDPSIDPGCLFLFLYGLERRALFDAITSGAARSQIPEIVREIKRLLHLHHFHDPFESRVQDLLDALQAAWPKKRIHSNEPPRGGYQGFYSWRFEFGLGRMVAGNKPIPVDWILPWVMLHPDARIRVPAKRCPEELGALFAKRFQETFGDGVRFKASKSRLRLRYRPLNPTIDYDRILFKSNLYEPLAPKGLATRLFDFFDRCQTELDPYSRALGKNPGARGSLSALALLPEDMIESCMNREAVNFRAWALEKSKKETAGAEKPEEPGALVEVDRFFIAWPTKEKGGFLAPEAMGLARLLERWGMGVEPDPRFGGPPFKVGGKAVLFELPGNASTEPAPEYAAAAILMRLSVMIAAANGDASKAERAYLNNHVQSDLSLSKEEKRRLLAHLRWLLAANPGLHGVKKRLRGVSEADRRDMGWFLITAAGVDGDIRPDEIKLLVKLYRTLDLDPDEVYSHIHAFSTDGSPENGPAATGPSDENREANGASARPGEAPVPGGVERGVSLDMEGVRRKMEETAKVSAVLENIFTEDTEPPVAISSPAPDETLAGLDASHTAMFRELAKRPSWTREEFETLALQFHLPPDGALENINEAAWDISDEPLCEDDDCIELDPDVLKEMLK